MVAVVASFDANTRQAQERKADAGNQWRLLGAANANCPVLNGQIVITDKSLWPASTHSQAKSRSISSVLQSQCLALKL
jgi:hypothetical protein